MTLKDLTGERYSRLTVVGRAPDYVSPSGKHLTCWVCRCDCGETVTVTGVHLKSGHTQSCGCYSHDQAVDRSRNPESPGCVKRKSNRSGVPGVWYEADSNRWRASVHVNKRTFHLGSYHSLEEAREARKRAEKEFYGDFAYEE